MNCINCNTPLEPDAKFCGACGQIVSASSASPIGLKCSNCQAELETSFQFCGECGHPVSNDLIPPQPIVPTPPSAQTSAPQASQLEDAQKPPSKESSLTQPQIEIPPTTGSAAATVMADQVQPPTPISAEQPPPPIAQQPIPPSPPALEQSQKRPWGCVIAVVVLLALVCCCLGSIAGAWFLFSTEAIDIPSSWDEFPLLEDLLREDLEDNFFDPLYDGPVILTIQNTADTGICELYITPSISDAWGDNWLAYNEIIPQGGTITVQIEPNQIVDVKVLDCDGYVVGDRYGILISGEEFFISIGFSP